MKEEKIVNQFMAEKAGMANVDKETIGRIVEGVTKGTHKYIFEKEQEEKRKV